MNLLFPFLALVIGHIGIDRGLADTSIGEATDRSTPLGSMLWQNMVPVVAFIHGLFVALVTDVWWLGAAEFVCGSAIGLLDGVYQFRPGVRWFLRLACKAAWVAAAYFAR